MKKLMSVVLALILAIAITPVFTTEVYAADYRIEKAIEWAIAIANDNSHGYSQSSRNGPNYDCSSFVSHAFKNAGFAISGTPNSSSMISKFGAVGFKAYKKGTVTPKRGDIFLRPGSHAELYIGNDTCVAAHEDTDGKSGDSKGNEIDVRHNSKCSWCRNQQYTYILRYEGPETYTYTFSYNTRQGDSSTGSFTAEMNKEFTVNYSAAKDGFTLSGWNVQRCRDNKWFTENGWYTEEQIYQNEYSKSVYSNGTKLTFNDEWTSSYSCDTDYIFYAVWTPDEYTVSFDSNGGANAPASQIKLHGYDMSITTAMPVRAGYAFLGWAESPAATIPTYLPGTAYYSNQSITLYAVWGTSNKGDLYSDGQIDTSDFALFKLLLAEYSGNSIEGIDVADYNSDGYVNSLDMACMKVYLAGI